MSHRYHRATRCTGAALGAALVLGAALAISPGSAAAQGSLRDQTRATDDPDRIIAINPFLPLFGHFQGEYEQRIRPNVSFALGGSYVKWDDYYTNVDVKLRLYPQERALSGLGLAGGLGYGAARRGDDVCDDLGECHRDKRTESAPTFSVEAQYQWLLGNSRATAVTIGGGLKRYFISESRSDGIQRVLPTLRLTIGYAF